jgi:hypothetical protein
MLGTPPFFSGGRSGPLRVTNWHRIFVGLGHVLGRSASKHRCRNFEAQPPKLLDDPGRRQPCRNWRDHLGLRWRLSGTGTHHQTADEERGAVRESGSCPGSNVVGIYSQEASGVIDRAATRNQTTPCFHDAGIFLESFGPANQAVKLKTAAFADSTEPESAPIPTPPRRLSRGRLPAIWLPEKWVRQQVWLSGTSRAR